MERDSLAGGVQIIDEGGYYKVGGLHQKERRASVTSKPVNFSKRGATAEQIQYRYTLDNQTKAKKKSKPDFSTLAATQQYLMKTSNQ
jgi:hypothetical protein